MTPEQKQARSLLVQLRDQLENVLEQLYIQRNRQGAGENEVLERTITETEHRLKMCKLVLGE